MTIRTPAFQSGQVIPAKYSCEGADISPPLQWTEVRAGAKSLSLIFDDPDAPVGTRVHWVLYNLPVMHMRFPEAERSVPPESSGFGRLDQ
jgi:Raf kinase inhibitor-like YbhB/YbcL family protein